MTKKTNAVERFISMMEAEGRSKDEILDEVRRLISMAFEKSQKSEPKKPAAQSVFTDEETRIISLLRKFGVPSGIKGYTYLREAIHQWRKNPEQSTMGLYSNVAEKFGTTSIRVERAIRHAIECAYERCDYDTLIEVFGNSISMRKGKPTNTETISRLAECLDLGEF